MADHDLDAINRWPFPAATSSDGNDQTLLFAILAANTLDEISTAEDYEAVRRYIIGTCRANAAGKTIVGATFWLYPTGLHGPFHIDEHGTVHQHGVLITLESGASVESAVETLIRETTVIEGISHIHIPGDNSNMISF